MASASISQSEGEVSSSDSESKAKSIPSSRNYSKVDRHTRPYQASQDSVPRSNRSRSRSPYRAPRGEKRPRESDHARGSSFNDSRNRSLRHETDAHRHRSRNSYDDRSSKRSRTYSRSRSRSRSPYRHGRKEDGPRDGRLNPAGHSTHRLSLSPKPSASPLRNSRTTQLDSDSTSRMLKTEIGQRSGSSKEIPHSASLDAPVEIDMTESKPVDEASLIEERRKRREAIKNKYRGQAPSLLVQALHVGADSTPGTPGPSSLASTPRRSESPTPSSPRTPRDMSGPQSPADVQFDNDVDLANGDRASPGEDGPSAADYDPTKDMEDERARHDKSFFKEDDQSLQNADPGVGQTETDLVAPPAKGGGDFDMFADDDEDDMFAEAPMQVKTQVKTAQALDVNLMDNWDDAEGYYITILGELIQDRYHVTQNLGRGMFSSVVRATDSQTNNEVAIKIVRNNESMRRAGIKEIDILKDIESNDPEDKKHLIRLLRSFDHKGHLCMVFENLSMNLREVLKKFGRDVGINIKAIRAYAQQLFLGLSLLKKCQYIHADLKPDNILVNESRSALKICDLGSASPITENATAPYLVSRFYRAPEVILGIPYDYGIDMWSIGCTLFELYTGKILFTGRNNNGMLRAIMEYRGKFPHKLLRRGALTYEYFDEMLNFQSQEIDKLTGRTVTKMIDIKAKPVKDLRSRLIPKDKKINEQERKEMELFVDLLDKCLDLRPEKRITPIDALKHPFIIKAKA
ncbi:hypothetical protein LTR84_008469 [Exophiala bonariae]|uniref:non-specific serine/threonine protein kinase n=1 Tax=Exophiala bonariae TaxID=1690606 RepID=A0AAV9MXN7_9EURO|nr:hypothetical protein LTR84_008469 [Exophiala bonariae]